MANNWHQGNQGGRDGNFSPVGNSIIWKYIGKLSVVTMTSLVASPLECHSGISVVMAFWKPKQRETGGAPGARAR